jgi:hypothetical protein
MDIMQAGLGYYTGATAINTGRNKSRRDHTSWRKLIACSKLVRTQDRVVTRREFDSHISFIFGAGVSGHWSCIAHCFNVYPTWQ